MHDQPTRGLALSPAESDDQLQAVALNHLLDLYPALLRVAEVQAELRSDDPRLDSAEGVDRALRDLRCAGLIHRSGEFVFPTRAAGRFGGLPPV